MNIVGVDVAKDSLVCVAINRSEKIKEIYTIENTSETIEVFLDLLSQKYKHLTIASEATAEYHLNLARACLERNIPFRLLNPIVTKQFTCSTVRNPVFYERTQPLGVIEVLSKYFLRCFKSKTFSGPIIQFPFNVLQLFI